MAKASGSTGVCSRDSPRATCRRSRETLRLRRVDRTASGVGRGVVACSPGCRTAIQTAQLARPPRPVLDDCRHRTRGGRSGRRIYRQSIRFGLSPSTRRSFTDHTAQPQFGRMSSWRTQTGLTRTVATRLVATVLATTATTRLFQTVRSQCSTRRESGDEDGGWTDTPRFPSSRERRGGVRAEDRHTSFPEFTRVPWRCSSRRQTHLVS